MGESMPQALTSPADRFMTVRGLISAFTQQEDLNFLLTNRIPRAAADPLHGLVQQDRAARWCATSRSPAGGCSPISISREASKTEFKSLHDCFTRELKAGPAPGRSRSRARRQPQRRHRRRVRPNCGHRAVPGQGRAVFAARPARRSRLVEHHRNGRFVTLRLTSSMYHRFHAPHDCRIERVTLIYGDTWNVNPIALKRVERLFCKNERAVIQHPLAHRRGADAGAGRRDPGRQHPPAFPRPRPQRADEGPTVFPCDVEVRKGEELGWFEHGSTIIVLAPGDFEFCNNIAEWARIRAGEPLMRRPSAD